MDEKAQPSAAFRELIDKILDKKLAELKSEHLRLEAQNLELETRIEKSKAKEVDLKTALNRVNFCVNCDCSNCLQLTHFHSQLHSQPTQIQACSNLLKKIESTKIKTEMDSEDENIKSEINENLIENLISNSTVNSNTNSIRIKPSKKSVATQTYLELSLKKHTDCKRIRAKKEEDARKSATATKKAEIQPQSEKKLAKVETKVDIKPITRRAGCRSRKKWPVLKNQPKITEFFKQTTAKQSSKMY